jgi:CMP-N-acetylneuraminic acid synthetase
VINGKRCLGVIPARGGSKRLPRKNIMLLAEKPLIQWTIEAGLNSLVIDHVIVSTDDIEIADVAHACGADVPFMRPAELGTDGSNSYVVLEHAYQTLMELGEDYAYIAMLQPTSPFRTAKHIDDAANLLEERDADGVLGVTEIGHPVQWCNTLPESLEMHGFVNVSDMNSPSQQFEKKYCLNGAIYITSIDRMLKENSHIYGSSMFAFIMDRRDSIDIDTALDFEIAEFFMRK